MLKPSKKGQSVTLDWTPEADAAFPSAKEALSRVSTLCFPSPGANISISTDASSIGVGAVPQQHVGDGSKPVAFFSKNITPTEAKYSTFDRELPAIYCAIKRFRYFVEGQQFHVFIDHETLTAIFHKNKSTYTRRQLRHIEYVSQFTMDIFYIKAVTTSQLMHSPTTSMLCLLHSSTMLLLLQIRLATLNCSS